MCCQRPTDTHGHSLSTGAEQLRKLFACAPHELRRALHLCVYCPKFIGSIRSMGDECLTKQEERFASVTEV